MSGEKQAHAEPFHWIGSDAFADGIKFGHLLHVVDKWHWHTVGLQVRRRSGWRSTEWQARRMVEAAYGDFLRNEIANPRTNIPSAQLRLFWRPGDNLARLMAVDTILHEMGWSYSLSVRRLPSLRAWRYGSGDGRMLDLRWQVALYISLPNIVEDAVDMASKDGTPADGN